MDTIEKQFKILLKHITDIDTASSIDRMEKATEACQELLSWTDFLKSLFPECCASELLDGAKSAMLESVAYIGLGLNRAAIGAMRTQIDLLLGFTFFYNHPHEWDSVNRTGSGFQLRSDIDKYHKETRKGFASNISVIENSEGSSLLSTYRILSAHIHGQSPLTVPKAGKFIELISSDSFLDSLIELQSKVSRCTSNYLTAIFLSEGINPPLNIGTRVKEQLKPQQRKTIFFNL